MKAISITTKNWNTTDGKDYGYFMGNNYTNPEKDCQTDPCDWGDEAEKEASELNEIFDKSGDNLIAKVEKFQ